MTATKADAHRYCVRIGFGGRTVVNEYSMASYLRRNGTWVVGFVRLPAGADLRPATKGLPDDLCPCRTGATCSMAASGCTRPTATRTSPPARRSTGPRAMPRGARGQ